MQIAAQTVLPIGGPNSIKDLSPPGAVMLSGTNAARLVFACTAGTVDLTPHWWSETASKWIPLQASTIGTYKVGAAAAGPATASDVFMKAAEPQWWALLATGSGTIGYCDLMETVK